MTAASWPAVSEGIGPDALLDARFHGFGDRQGLWQWMRRNSPVHWHEPGRYPGFWSVTCYEHVRQVYANPQTFSSAGGVLLRANEDGPDPAMQLAMALTDPPDHQGYRKIMAPYFDVRAVAQLSQSVAKRVRMLLTYGDEKGVFDFAELASALTLATTADIIGIPASDHSMLLDWMTAAFSQEISILSLPECMLYLCELMEECVRAPADNLMSGLVTADLSGRKLSSIEVLINLENLLGATENAALSIAAGISAFAEFQAEWQILIQTPELIGNATEETLRWTSSATHSLRTVTKETVFAGTRMKAGDRVVVWIPSANRDEAHFVEPQRFSIRHKRQRNAALGGGVHTCIGAGLARMQFGALLNAILEREWQPEHAGAVEPVLSLAVGGLKSLPIRMRR